MLKADTSAAAVIVFILGSECAPEEFAHLWSCQRPLGQSNFVYLLR
jgi:hypothetical protein